MIGGRIARIQEMTVHLQHFVGQATVQPLTPYHEQYAHHLHQCHDLRKLRGATETCISAT